MPSSALPSLDRPALRVLALAALLIAAPSLHASPLTYQMTFTSGSHTGTGTLTLASQPATSGVTTDTAANRQLQDLAFTVAGQTFDFSTDPSASVQFINGQLARINFGQIPGHASNSYTVEFSSGFSLYGSDLTQPLVSGNYTVTPALAAGAAPTQST